MNKRRLIYVGLGLLAGIAAILILVAPLVLAGLVAAVMAIWGIVQIVNNPFAGVLGIAFFLPFERIGGVAVGGSNFRISQVIALLTMLSWLWHKTRRSKLQFHFNPTFWPLFVFLLFALLSILNAINVMRGINVWIFTAFTLFTSLLVADLVDTRHRLWLVVKVMIGAAFITSLFGLFQFVGDEIGLSPALTLIRWGWYNKAVLGMTRVQAFSLEPLYLANYLLSAIPLVAALIVVQARGKWKTAKLRLPFPLWFLLGVLVTTGLAFILTLSRGGYIALAAALLVVLLLAYRDLFSKRVVMLVLALALCFGLVMAISGKVSSKLSVDYLAQRATTLIASTGDYERLEQYRTAYDAFKVSPLLGFGPGNYGAYISGVYRGAPTGGWNIVNDEYLELLDEVGLIGTLALLLAVLVWFVQALAAFGRSVLLEDRILLMGLIATMVGFWVQYVTFSTLYIMHIWFVFGLGIASSRLAPRPNSSAITEG